MEDLPEGKAMQNDEEDGGLVLVDSYKGEVARITVDNEGRVTRIEADTLISVEKDGIQWLIGLEDYKVIEKKLETAKVEWSETEDGFDVLVGETGLLRLEFTKDPQFFGAATLEQRR